MDWLNVILNTSVIFGMAETLLHFTWQGCVLASLLYFLLKNIDSRRSEMRYCVSLFILSLCAIAPVITFFLVYESQTSLSSVSLQQAITEMSETAAHAGSALINFNDASSLLWTLSATELNQTISQFQLQSILPLVAIVWMLGVVLLSARLILQVFNVHQLPRQGTSAPDAQLQTMFENLIKQLGVAPVTRLLISSKVDVPMAIGWLKPVVLLPTAIVVGLAPNQLEMLLAHELAHVRRHDYVVNFIQTLVEVMLFFHPGIKWISKQIRAERENCCDDVAVSHCGSAVAYAKALTEAEMSRFTNIPELAMAASGSDLKQRVFRVVGQTNCAPSTTKHKFTGLLAALVSLTVVVSVFSIPDVTGMPHTDTGKNKDDMLLLIEPSVPAGEVSKAKQNSIESAKASTAKPSAVDVNVILASEQQETGEISALGADKSQLQSKNADDDIVESSLSDSQNTDKHITVSNSALPTSVDNGNVSDINDSAKEPAMVESETENKSFSENAVVAVEQTVSSKGLSRDMTSNPDTNTIPKIESDSALALRVDNIIETEIAEIPVQKLATKPQPSLRKAPVLIESAHPDYPRRALMRKLTADVRVSFVVTSQGQVTDIEFDQDTQRIFRSSVRRALSKWRFEAATENGKKVPSKMTRVFSFTDPDQDSLTMTGSRIVRLHN
ncbi:MAG: M56 family metallopeptidase [Aestuariibacter sp.]